MINPASPAIDVYKRQVSKPYTAHILPAKMMALLANHYDGAPEDCLLYTSISDDGIGGGDRGLIVRMVLLMVALGLIGLVSSVTAQYFSCLLYTSRCV